MTSLQAPEITQHDLVAFHALHFSGDAVAQFSQKFGKDQIDQHLAYDEVEEYYLDDDDDLGYYPDGVKRTLTDEQIAIFRHSEIQALLREGRHAESATSAGAGPKNSAVDVDEGEHEDAELNNSHERSKTGSKQPLKPQDATISKKAKRASKAMQKGWFRQNAKPDLRKRTWDKVEAGLGDLNYDDDEGNGAAAASASSCRRRISYGDD